MPDLQIHYADDWAALYVDGNLDHVGDTYRTEERAFEILGVPQVQDDAFMRGQKQRDGVAPTLADVQTYRQQRAADRAEAARLREQATKLLADAAKLDAGRKRAPNA